MNDRPTIRCPHCELNQFMADSCRRCHKSFVIVKVIPQAPVVAPKPMQKPQGNDVQANVARALKFYRKALRLSQSELAKRLLVPRTYLSKIENGRCLPRLTSLQNIADALEITLQELTGLADMKVLEDPFIQELLPYVRSLSAEDRQTLLNNAVVMAWRSA